MKAYMKRHLPHPFSLLLPAALAWAASLLAGCTDGAEEWIPDGRTASVTLHVPMACTRSTRTTDEEYKAAEEKINTLRVLVFSQDKPIINKQFEEAALSGGSVTIEGVPVGTVDIYAVANEAALGKDYSDMADFENNLVQVGDTKKALVMDEHRAHFPKRFTEQEVAQYGLPMSWHRDVQITPSGNTPQTIEVELERSVAKLNVIMNNTLSHPITITSMNFGQFFGDRLYLFREQTLDVPDDTRYYVQSYENLDIEIEGYGSKTLALYIYPSYAWKDASKNSPYTIGFTTSTAPYDDIPFINEYGGALNSIERNKQVNIHATLTSEANLTLKFEVTDWVTEEITVPPFN
ncbi:FimB/Mfa2 family fimbrial subunit [Bacteroides thetaiotaomicron]|uniref:FimB/Mfa2 family fimbrial subunit n=1 Tax=Bacteroides thetaiotaomicron TaxID=818 RepID=UPI0039B5D76C